MKYYIILALINLFLCSEIAININEEINLDNSHKDFKLEYSKGTEKPSIFILFYENFGEIIVEITDPNSIIQRTIIYEENGENGYITFPFIKNGTYKISFSKLGDIKGKFKIVSSDKTFNLDINRDIVFQTLYIRSELEPYPLIFSLENSSNEDFIKTIRIDKIKLYKMYISENGINYKEIIGEFIYLNKDSNYWIKLEFLKYIIDIHEIPSFQIQNFYLNNLELDLIKIEDFSIGSKVYKNIKYLFYKINLKDNNKFYVRTDSSVLSYFNFSYIDNEEQYNNFPNGIQYLDFNNSLINKEIIKIEKPKDKDYMIIFIEFNEQENNFINFIKEVSVELNKENYFDGTNTFFKLNYEKKNSDNALLCLFYEFKNENEEKIEIKIFKDIDYIGSRNITKINKDSFNFLVENSGEYLILLTSIGTVEGNFTIVSSEYEFSIDAHKEIYFYNDFIEEVKFQSILTFDISNIDKNYKKLYSSINNLEDIISYKKNKNENEEFLPMKKGIFLYEKGDSIIIKLDIKKINSDDYIHISNLDENNILDLEFNYYKFLGPINKIFKINYLSSPYFKIEGDDSNRYYISYVDKTRYDNIDKCLGNLTFNKYNDNIYIKPINEDYAILIVEIINKVVNKTLTLTELDPPLYDLNFDFEQIFNSFYSKYKLEYEKKENNEMFIFMYKMNEYSNNFEININGPNNYVKAEVFDNKEKIGSFAFENGENGDYIISFNSEKNFEGIFKIVKTSDPIKININDIIKLNTFNTTFMPDPIIMKFNTTGLGDNTYKEFLIGENNKNLNLIKISTDDSEYKDLNLNYYAFEKEKEYKIKIEYNNIGDNITKFEQFIMNNFEFNLEDFQYGSKTYKNTSKIQFIKIDLTKFSNIVVKTDNDPIIKVVYYNDDLNMAKILNDLIFKDLKDNTISDKSYKKAILMIKLNPVETKIDFKKEDDDDDDNNNTLFIALGIGGGVLLLLIIIFLIYRYRKRKSAEPNISGEDTREELMPQTD